MFDTIEKFNTNTLNIECNQRDGHLDYLVIDTPLAHAEVHLQGAHLTSYIPKAASEVLWLSPLAKFEKQIAIRGGIPICWPWFGKHPEYPQLAQHGFARNSRFKLSNLEQADDLSVTVTMTLSSSDITFEGFPYSFLLTVIFVIGESLSVELLTENCSNSPMPISQAIHSYFSVDDIVKTKLLGLSNHSYWDQLALKEGKQIDSELKFDQETDRIYQTSNAHLDVICDRHRIHIEQENENASVVWNPWENKSKLMSDFPDSGYKHMLCVEAAHAGERIFVAPGEQLSLKQCITVR